MGRGRRGSARAAVPVALGLALLAGCTAHPKTGRLVYAPEAPAPGYAWRLPPGFPVPAVPEDNPITAAKVELGRRLFHDRRLSGNGTQSCASCHRQELAFTDGRARAVGSTGEVHPLGAMSLANAAYNAAYNWADPRLRTLEQQIRVPLYNTRPVELGIAGREREVLERFRADPGYRERFAAAFPGEADPIRIDHVIAALASFVRTLISGGSAFDRLVWGGDEDALGPAARRGMSLFFSERLGCGECHAGFNLSGPVRTAESGPVEPDYHNTGLHDPGGSGSGPPGSRGLHEVTGRREHLGRFRAPTLRNIARTAPYMHDGSLPSLEAVVEHYERGGRDGRFKSPRIRGFRLEPGEREDLLEFLESLTDEAFLRDPRFAPPAQPGEDR